jgi:hypothetical protein
MVTRGGKSIIEVLGVTAKYFEEGYAVHCSNIVAITINSMTLSSFLKKTDDKNNGT